MTNTEIIVSKSPRTGRWNWRAKRNGHVVAQCKPEGIRSKAKCIEHAREYGPRMVGGEFEMLTVIHSTANSELVWRKKAF